MRLRRFSARELSENILIRVEILKPSRNFLPLTRSYLTPRSVSSMTLMVKMLLMVKLMEVVVVTSSLKCSEAVVAAEANNKRSK